MEGQREERKNLTIVIQQNIVWFHVSVKDGSICIVRVHNL